jgi:Fic family protein
LLGLLGAIGLEQANAVQRDLWVQEALATAAIEGEQLNLESLRSSVAHRLSLADAPGADRSVDGLVQVMGDALANHAAALGLDRLCRWQSALFPGGTSGITRIAVGRVRDHADAMQIVSGALGREVVHYEAPPSAQVTAEMARFLAWFESTRPTAGATAVNGLARAALVHLWFESIHPFEDGNGRLGRALADMALAQDMHAQDANASPALVRVYGMACQMLKTRSDYYDALNQAQRLRGIAPEASVIDATPWVQWFVQAFTRACFASQAVVRDAADKAQFRLRAAQCQTNARQRKVLERLLEAGHVASGGGFLGGMSSDKYAKITGASKATATRDLADLLAHGLLRVSGIGKATRYCVNVPGWEQPLPES